MRLPASLPTIEILIVVVARADATCSASMEFIRKQGQRVSLASYDGRVIDAARSLKIPMYKL
jgi:hypothetical protein